MRFSGASLNGVLRVMRLSGASLNDVSRGMRLSGASFNDDSRVMRLSGASFLYYSRVIGSREPLFLLLFPGYRLSGASLSLIPVIEALGSLFVVNLSGL